MNTLVTSQYQPRLSSITKISSRRISQSDRNIQIKLNYSQMSRLNVGPQLSWNGQMAPPCPRLYLHNLVWVSLRFSYSASRFIKRKQTQTRLYRITCSPISNIPFNGKKTIQRENRDVINAFNCFVHIVSLLFPFVPVVSLLYFDSVLR
jgi:hypothetical protein